MKVGCPECGGEVLVSARALFRPKPSDPRQGTFYGTSLLLLDEHHAVCNMLGCEWQGTYGEAKREG